MHFSFHHFFCVITCITFINRFSELISGKQTFFSSFTKNKNFNSIKNQRRKKSYKNKFKWPNIFLLLNNKLIQFEAHHLTNHNSRFILDNSGNFIIVSMPIVDICVHPYKSIAFKLTRYSDSDRRPLSVIRLHWPMYNTSRSCNDLAILASPSSVIWQWLRLSDFRWNSPWEMWFKAWSPILSQKLTSSDDIVLPPGIKLGECVLVKWRL